MRFYNFLLFSFMTSLLISPSVLPLIVLLILFVSTSVPHHLLGLPLVHSFARCFLHTFLHTSDIYICHLLVFFTEVLADFDIS